MVRNSNKDIKFDRCKLRLRKMKTVGVKHRAAFDGKGTGVSRSAFEVSLRILCFFASFYCAGLQCF